MNHSALRHAGNYAVLITLIFVGAFGTDRLAVWLGWRPLASCFLSSIAMLNQTVAVWLVAVGLLLVIVGWNRRLGIWMMLAGTAFSQLPGLLAAHLGPFCSSR